jgi:hypothetical protein
MCTVELGKWMRGSRHRRMSVAAIVPPEVYLCLIYSLEKILEKMGMSGALSCVLEHNIGNQSRDGTALRPPYTPIFAANRLIYGATRPFRP